MYVNFGRAFSTAFFAPTLLVQYARTIQVLVLSPAVRHRLCRMRCVGYVRDRPELSPSMYMYMRIAFALISAVYGCSQGLAGALLNET